MRKGIFAIFVLTAFSVAILLYAQGDFLTWGDGSCLNGQVPTWDAGASKWKCQTPAGGGSGGIVAFSLGTSIAANSTMYFGIANGNNTQGFVQVPLATALNPTKMYCRVRTAPGAGQTDIFTLMKGATPTTITCTVADTATSCNDTAHSATFAEGDLWSWRVVTSATAAATSAEACSVY